MADTDVEVMDGEPNHVNVEENDLNDDLSRSTPRAASPVEDVSPENNEDTPSPTADQPSNGLHTSHGEEVPLPPPPPPRNNDAIDQSAPTRDSTIVNPPILEPSAVPKSPDRHLSPSKPSSPQSPGKMMRGLSGEFLVSSPPPPSSADRQRALEQRQIGERVTSPPSTAGSFNRKPSTGFGAFFGRIGTMRKSTPSPSATRRNTTASSASVDSNGLASVDGIDGESSVLPRLSLQDQFTNLRKMSEYTTVDIYADAVDEQEAETSAASPTDTDIPRPSTATKESAEKRTSNPSILMSPPLNPSLPPGTASGLTAGPAEEPKEVNWDLWQQLVYEGPTAVSRTSGEELNAAIASGIPPAIRGVVWQVLADSKNDELETIYRALKAKGTDAERPPLPSRNPSTVSVNVAASEKDATKSERSSVHSDHSTATYSRPASPPTSVESTSQDLLAKLEEAEKRKQEAAALQKLEKAIKRDLGARTSFSKYAQSPGLQDGLFGVCKAYALYDEAVGYAQGINFIAMPLLFNMSEEEAFTVLARLMSKYDVRSMFTPDMVGLHLRLHHFERLLEDYEPAISCHLRRRHVHPQLYATPWFLTLFAYRFPLQLVLRVYDLIFSEGLTAILKFGIVLMQRNRDALLAMQDMSQLTTFLKEKLFDVYIDQSPSASSLLDSGFFGSVSGGADKELYRADQMVRDACQIHISDDTLARYTAEWEESQRTERAKEQELESLRTGNIALVAQVKSLEDRVLQHDAEHVRVAQDMVRIKVENDALQDSNEGLKLQVTELQKLLDCQPAEIEEKLKEEMERIMKRNIEVQNENRALKEEMDEMEHVLVNSKMAQAQTQSDHDNLKQRWASVQALLSDKATT